MRRREKDHIRTMILLYLKYIRERKRAEEGVRWETVERWLNSIADYVKEV